MRPHRPSHRDTGLLAALLVLALAGLVGLARQRTQTTPTTPPTPVRMPVPAPARAAGDGEDFRFLLAILTGVALGTAVFGLPALLSGELRSDGVPAILWATSLSAVVLVYLSILHGSRLTVGRVDAADTTVLIGVTLAECGLFVCATLGPAAVAAHRWFECMAVFSFLATTGIFLARRRVLRWPPDDVPAPAVRTYTASLSRDMAMAAGQGAGCVAYAVAVPRPSPVQVVIAGGVLLLFLVAATAQQIATRRKLRFT